MIEKFLYSVVTHRKWVLFVTIALVFLALSQARQLHLEIDPAKVLPQSHPYVKSHEILEKVFGEKYAMVITISTKEGDVFQPDIVEKIQQITDGIAATPYVVRHNILSLTSPRAKIISESADGMLVEPLIKATGGNEEEYLLFEDIIISQDKKTTSIIALFDKGPLGYWQVIQAVEPIIEKARDPTVEIYVGGHAQVLGTIELFSERMLIFVPLAIVLIGLIHYEAFRSIQGLVLPLVTANLALIFGLGIMGATGIPLDVFNATTPILILAIAAGHAVQILKRYYEEFDLISSSGAMSAEEANKLAIIKSLTRIGPFMLAAGLIAALGFLSLMVFEIATVRTFGFFTGVGILSAVIVEFTFIPALRAMLPAPAVAMKKRVSIWDKLVSSLDHFSKKGWTVVVLTLLLIGSSVLASRYVVVENSNKSNMAADLQIRKDDDAINQKMAGSQIIYFMFDGGAPNSILQPSTLNGIENLQAFLDAQSIVGRSIGITDYLKRMNKVLSTTGDKLPNSDELSAQYLLLYSMSADPTDFDSFIDRDYQRANLKVFIKDDSSIQVENLIQAVKAEAARVLPNVKMEVGGGVAEAAALNEVLVRDKLLNIVQISLVVFLLSALLFKSLIAGLYVLLPVSLAVLVNFALLGLFGIPLSVPTSVISAMAVGVGADYAIYLLSRIREEHSSYGLDEAVSVAMKSAGLACIYVATAVTAGYGLLVFSFGFRVHQYLGLLIASAMVVSSLATLLLIPTLARMCNPSFLKSMTR